MMEFLLLVVVIAVVAAWFVGTNLAAVAAVWLVVNLAAVLWLAHRFADRPWGFNATPRLSRGLLVGCSLIGACAGFTGESVQVWALVAVWGASLCVPVWGWWHRRRFPRWAPMPRRALWEVAALAWVCCWLFQMSPALAVALVGPLLVVWLAVLLRPTPVPAFAVADHSQPWWPRTPGHYRDAARMWTSRAWDGSGWLDEPDRVRQVRRARAESVTTQFFMISFVWAVNWILERDSVGTHPGLGAVWPWGDGWAGWTLLVAAVLVVVAAWRRLDRPLPADDGFAPTGRPWTAFGSSWLRDPDDPDTSRYWDGEAWTERTAPLGAEAVEDTYR